MPLILAIEPDKRQSAQLATLVKGLQAELVLRTSAAEALGALHGRVPDLVLTTSLISPRDDAALAAHLRELGPDAAHVQTVTIPVLGSAAPKRAKGGMLAALRREKPAPMTDGCAPDVFADQIRQYLATAEEQKASAATRVVAEAVAEETVAPEDTIVAAEFLTPFVEPEPAAFEAASIAEEPEPVVETPIFSEPVEAEIEVAAASEVEPIVEPVEEAVVEPEGLLADEPAGMPLSQLLQLVSDAAPIAAAPLVEAPIFETPILETPIVETLAIEMPVVEMTAEAEVAPIAEPVDEAEPQPITSFDDLYVDPMAAQALDELSRKSPMAPLAYGIPGEPPVPVVEMHSFQNLDAIASELAAGPAERRESLDDLAGLFAATPAAPAPPAPPAPAERITDFSTPMHGEKSLFASLFAEPASTRPSRPIEVPDVDPGLFATAPAAPVTVFDEPEPVMAVEPAPVLAMEPEPVLAIEPEPILAVEPEPMVAVEPEPMLAAEPEPTREEPVLLEAAPVEAAEDEPLITFEPVVFEPVLEEPLAVAAAPALDEEIALDVDAFAFTAPEPAAPAASAPAEPSRFSFTLVDGFGDAWSDFDVPSVSAVASDLGVGDHPPLDPYAARPASALAALRDALREPAAAPSLDQESLSLIGDAARKLSLDAMVIEEFERGIPARRLKKAKKKIHAGATAVPPSAPTAAPAAPKRPVQDEWGMFDPEQCGFAALDEEEGAEPRPTTGTRVRVISY